ncbi:hypothetical protein L3X38_030297 [Prunus dulcis]|uniref:Uncharacterized protein n=1 Tax=Prunus dulcis TaxID=3755 RepID=A0AAD4VC65_PRUDU|nr:hypothetical protein L3X38_030297 [Prunus dulcis]
MAAGGGRSSSLNFGLNSVGFLHFPASTGHSGGWDWSGWKEEDGTVLLGPVPPQVVAGCGGGGPKTAAVNSSQVGFLENRLSRKNLLSCSWVFLKEMDELQKQVSEGKVRVDGSKDVLTMALGPEHPGRLRGVGAGISPRQYFNLPKPQRVSFDDRLKESLRVLLQEETNKMEAKAKEEALRMEARTKQLVEAEREHFLSQLSQLIPNFDPGMLKQRISQSPKNPMSDKASCSGGEVKSLHYEDDNAKNGEHQQEEEKEEEKRDEEKEEEKEKKDEEKHDDKVIEVGDYSNMEAPSSLKSLCRYVETTLLPEDKLLQFTIDKEVFGGDRDTFLLPEDITQFAGMEEIGATVVAVTMRYLHDVLKQANMCSMVGFIDPATVSANSGTIAERSRLVAARLQKTDGEQIFMMPYNPGLVSLGFCF